MRIVVVGGGTATNAITPVFYECAHDITFVVPISDNGGSTSEILRVFGGPAIGDARSRLVRLIDPSPLRSLLAMRLSSNPQFASQDWNSIVDGTHSVWTEVSPYMKAMYRAFLVQVHAELLKKTTTMRKFDFSCASVGNLLLTGARIFFGTLEAAIEFVLHTNRVPAYLSVLPCLNSSFSHHIAATLEDGSVVVGQSQISHPTSSIEVPTLSNAPELGSSSGQSVSLDRMGSIHRARRHNSHLYEDDGVLFSHPSLQVSQIQFRKELTSPLPSRIDQVYYINTYGDEIRPSISPRVATHLQTSDAVIFSVGSLYTSIVPVLLPQGFAANMPRKCILILNGSSDRETEGMDSSEYLLAVLRALDYSLGNRAKGQRTPASLITNIIYPRGLPDIDIIKKNTYIHCESALCPKGEYNHDSLIKALKICMAI